MKRSYFYLVLSLLFMGVLGEGATIYYTQSRLFIVELDQEIAPGNETLVRPFLIIPNRTLYSLDEQKSFLRSMFHFKEIVLEREAKELKWEPRYRNKKTVFPRLIQSVQIEENKFELTLIPLGEDISIGYRIQVSLVKSLPEENKDILSPLYAVYEVPSESIVLNIEIRSFGDSFFVCFPAGKKMYIISFRSDYLIGSPIY